MTIFVLMKGGQPVELPAADAETVNRLMDHDDGVCSTFAFASTNRRYVEAMRQVLPDLLDADHGPEVYEIAEFTQS
jgi:hypothetical protein